VFGCFSASRPGTPGTVLSRIAGHQRTDEWLASSLKGRARRNVTRPPRPALAKPKQGGRPRNTTRVQRKRSQVRSHSGRGNRVLTIQKTGRIFQSKADN